jgi:outer membrane protein assembly factor BamD
MKLKTSYIAILLSAIIFLGTSCNKYQKILKKGDLEQKYETAFKLYEKGDYITALQFLDELIPLYRGSEKLQKLMYIYPYSYYKNGDFMVASYHFKQYSRLFPNTPEAEECDYMSAYCSYMDSPPSSLEQTNTHKAIKDLQIFINKYPNSERIAKCNELIDELRDKLSRKDFNIAKMYFHIESYSAASIAFNNLIKEYPDTKHKEEAMYYLVKNYYQFATKSTEARKKERFYSAIEAHSKLKENFPESSFLKETENIAKSAERQIERIK